MMDTNKMVENISREKVALCIEGSFKGSRAKMLSNGLVVLVEKKVTYDFWDSRFNDCKWSFL